MPTNASVDGRSPRVRPHTTGTVDPSTAVTGATTPIAAVASPRYSNPSPTTLTHPAATPYQMSRGATRAPTTNASTSAPATANNCETNSTADVGDRIDARPPAKSPAPNDTATRIPRKTAM